MAGCCLLAAGLMLPACGGGSRTTDDADADVQGVRDRADTAFGRSLDGRDASGQVSPQQVSELPSWMMQPPQDPGRYYYGTGSGYFRSTATMQLGITTASQSARRALADTLRTHIQAATMRYMEQVIAADGTVVEESLARDISRAVTDHVVNGAEIVNLAFMEDVGTQGMVLFALARISFADVARSLEEQARRELERPVDPDQVEAALLDNLRRTGRDPGPVTGGPTTPGGDTSPGGPGTNPGMPTTGGNGTPGGMPTTGGRPPAFPTTGGTATQPGGTAPQAPAANPNRTRLWVDERRDPEYPPDQFLLGVGVGPTNDAAIASARQDLMAFFEAKLAGVTSVVSESLQRTEGDSLHVRESMQAITSVQQTVAGTLHGAFVAGTGAYLGNQRAALIALNKADFIQSTRAMIEQREREVAAALASATRLLGERRYVNAMRALAPAYRLHAEVLTLIQQHNLVASQRLQPQHTVTQIEDVLRQLGESLTLMLRLDVVVKHQNGDMEQQETGELQNRVQQALSTERSGITVRQTAPGLANASLDDLRRRSPGDLAALAGGASFVVLGRVDVQFNQIAHGRLYEYTATYTLDIIELTSGQRWTVSDQSGRNSRGTAQAAREAAGTALQRAASRMAYQIVDQFVRGN